MLSVIIFALFLWVIRKFIYIIPIKFSSFVFLHIFAGFSLIYLYLVHIRHSSPFSIIEHFINILIITIVVSGIFKYLCNKIFPKMLNYQNERYEFRGNYSQFVRYA